MAIYNGGLNIIAPDTYSKNEINDLIADKTRSNLLRPTLKTTTKNGVTCTYNGDGTYTINGTAQGHIGFIIGRVHIEKDKKYRIVGCPSGGTYEPEVGYKLYTNYDDTYAIDYGESQTFEPTRESISDVAIQVNAGTVCDNLLFKPMITYDLSATYDDFVSYNDSFIMGINNGTNMDLLWTNADIYGAFPEQTITLDTFGYKFFIAIFHGWEGQTSWVVSRLLQHGSNYVEHVRETSSRRFITVNDGSILFGDCARYLKYGDTTATVENKNFVPVKIYGVK